MVLYRGFSTQEELDEQYNLRESVPDFPAYEQFYNEQSKKTREQLECQLDVPFGPTLDERLDIFPAARSGAAILVFIHGGYWHTFSSKEFSFVASGPVSAGVTTVVINYALCPKVTIEEIVRQSRAAVAWLYSNAEAFGGDRTRIYVSGHSAGGHLTAMLTLTDWEGEYGLPADIIKGGCPISGLFDLRPFPYTYLQPKLQLTWGEVLRNSPILRLLEEAPPLLVSYGGEETLELRRQSDDFLAAWRSRGLRGEHLPQPGKDHFSAIDGFLDVGSPLCAAILRQMDSTSP
jgi:arylformamidase